MTEQTESPVVKLRKPVKLDGVDYTELTLRELTVNEIGAFQKQHGKKDPIDKDKAYFGLVCGVPSEVIGMLGQRDYNALSEANQDFLYGDQASVTADD